MHHARAFVAIHRAELAQPHRKIAIRFQSIFINKNVERAIHRLEPVFGVVKLHHVEHIFRIIAFVSRSLPELPPRDVWSVDKRIAALDVLRAHPVFHLFADDSALGMPENQPRSCQLLNGKQIKLLAQHAMVALLGLFDVFQILIEVFLRKERRAINSLKLRILFVPKPICARDVQQLESFDLPRRRNVRAAAEVSKFSRAVERNLFIGLGELLDEMALHEIAVVLKLLQSLFAR